jgi:hypothetical protein
LALLAEEAAARLQFRTDERTGVSLADHPIFLAAVARARRTRRHPGAMLEAILRDGRGMRELLRWSRWTPSDMAEGIVLAAALRRSDVFSRRPPSRDILFGLSDGIALVLLGLISVPMTFVIAAMQEASRAAAPGITQGLWGLLALHAFAILSVFLLFRSDESRASAVGARREHRARIVLGLLMASRGLRGNLTAREWRRFHVGRGCRLVVLTFAFLILLGGFTSVATIMTVLAPDYSGVREAIVATWPWIGVLFFLRLLAYSGRGWSRATSPSMESMSRLLAAVARDEWAAVDGE